MEALSNRQRSILEYMYARSQRDGILPSYREIGDAMGIRSTNGVSDHIKALVRKGYLLRIGGTGKAALARAMTLTIPVPSGTTSTPPPTQIAAPN